MILKTDFTHLPLVIYQQFIAASRCVVRVLKKFIGRALFLFVVPFVRNANLFGSTVCDVRIIRPYLEILKRAFAVGFIGVILAVKFLSLYGAGCTLFLESIFCSSIFLFKFSV